MPRAGPPTPSRPLRTRTDHSGRTWRARTSGGSSGDSGAGPDRSCAVPGAIDRADGHFEEEARGEAGRPAQVEGADLGERAEPRPEEALGRADDQGGGLGAVG